MQKFRSYSLAVTFYRSVRATTMPYYLKNQLERAASSVALNLREGAAQRSLASRRKYYRIAYASIKECQSIFDLESTTGLEKKADILAAHIFKLVKSTEQ